MNLGRIAAAAAAGAMLAACGGQGVAPYAAGRAAAGAFPLCGTAAARRRSTIGFRAT